MTLKEWLEKKKKPVIEFANEIGHSKAMIYRYLSGDAQPSKDTMITIYIYTDGEVEPKDWYILPDLSSNNRSHKNVS